jgi:hypothetical protein
MLGRNRAARISPPTARRSRKGRGAVPASPYKKRHGSSAAERRTAEFSSTRAFANLPRLAYVLVLRLPARQRTIDWLRSVGEIAWRFQNTALRVLIILLARLAGCEKLFSR